MLHFKNGSFFLIKSKNKKEGAYLKATANKGRSQFSFLGLDTFQVRLLGLLAGFILLANYIWLFVDKLPLAWDESIHYMGAFGYYTTFLKNGLTLFSNLLYQSDFYPPITEMLVGGLFLITGAKPDVAAFADIFFLFGIMICMLLLARKLVGINAGVMAVFAFIASSKVIIQSKFFMLDIPLTFFVLLGSVAYIYSEQFENRRWTIVYAFALSFAMLNKWSALFFLGLPPLITAIIQTIKDHDEKWRIWRHVIVLYLITGCIIGPWYSVHFIKLVKNTSGYIYDRGVLENDPALSSWRSWTYYLKGVINQASLLLGVGILGGFTWAMIRKKSWAFALLWIGLPYLILTFIRNKDFRYTLPLLPFFCIYSMGWLESLKDRQRKSIMLLMAVALLFQFGYVHFGTYAGSLHTLFDKKIAGQSLIDSQAPNPTNWPLAAILSEVDVKGQTMSHRPSLRVIPDAASFSKVTFVVERSQNDYDVHLSSITDWPTFTDFAVTKTGSLGIHFLIEKQKAITEELLNTTTAMSKRFEEIGRYDLPDQSQAYLFRRIEKVDEREAPVIIEELKKNITTLLSAYIRDTSQLAITIEPFSDEETRLGRFKRIRIRAEHGRVGDFKHKPFGVPFQAVDVEIEDIVLDLDGATRNVLLPYAIKALKLNELTVQAMDVNEAFSTATDDLKKLRLLIKPDGISARWIDRIPAEVSLVLSIGKDKHSAESDNLYFKLGLLKAGKVPVPGWMIQPFVQDFNPLIKIAGFPVIVKLGSVQLQENKLTIGILESAEDKLARKQ